MVYSLDPARGYSFVSPVSTIIGCFLLSSHSPPPTTILSAKYKRFMFRAKKRVVRLSVRPSLVRSGSTSETFHCLVLHSGWCRQTTANVRAEDFSVDIYIQIILGSAVLITRVRSENNRNNLNTNNFALYMLFCTQPGLGLSQWIWVHCWFVTKISRKR